MNEETLHNMSMEELEDAIKADRESETSAEEQPLDETTSNEAEYTEVEQEVVYTSLDETTPEENDVELFTVKANGKEFNLTKDEITKLASKGLDYTKKTTALKPYRTMISAIQENEITDDDINMLIDIKKGNKEALSKFVKDSGTDIYDLPDASDESVVNYTPTNYGKSEVQANFEDTISTLQSDPVFAQTGEVYKNLDDTSKKIIYNNPQMLVGLQQDIKSGVFTPVINEAEKLAALDGYQRPILDYYLQVGPSVVQGLQQQYQKQQREQAVLNKDLQQRKRSASMPKLGNKKPSIDVLADIDDEEAYQRWAATLERI